MATINTLVAQGGLIGITVPLEVRDQPIRSIYVTPEVRDWIANVLPNLPSETGAARSPAEQVDDILYHYTSSGGRLRYERMIKDLMPAKDEVWELKTADIRIFGWFYRKDVFIGAEIDLAGNVKRREAGYPNAITKVVNVREQIDLDAPKYVGGVINNVVSI